MVKVQNSWFFFFPSSKLRVERRHTHQLTFTFHTSITPLMEQTEIQRSTERRRIRGGRCVSVGGQRSEEDEQTEGEEQRPSSTEELSVAWCLLSYFLLHLLHLLLPPPRLSSPPFTSCLVLRDGQNLRNVRSQHFFILTERLMKGSIRHRPLVGSFICCFYPEHHKNSRSVAADEDFVGSVS